MQPPQQRGQLRHRPVLLAVGHQLPERHHPPVSHHRLLSRPGQPDSRERHRLQPPRHRDLRLNVGQVIDRPRDPGHQRNRAQPVNRVLAQPQQLSAPGIQPSRRASDLQRPPRALCREPAPPARLPRRAAVLSRHVPDATAPDPDWPSDQAVNFRPFRRSARNRRQSTPAAGQPACASSSTARPPRPNSRPPQQRSAPAPTPAAPTPPAQCLPS